MGFWKTFAYIIVNVSKKNPQTNKQTKQTDKNSAMFYLDSQGTSAIPLDHITEEYHTMLTMKYEIISC